MYAFPSAQITKRKTKKKKEKSIHNVRVTIARKYVKTSARATLFICHAVTARRRHRIYTALRAAGVDGGSEIEHIYIRMYKAMKIEKEKKET